jgi:hypothetical protein
MFTRMIAFMLLAIPALVGAQSLDSLKGMMSNESVKSATDALGGSSMSSLLQSQLGLSKNQADGGLGSVLSLASENLSSDEFEQLSGAIPGASGLMDSAKSLGAVTGPLKNIAGLNSALSSLGIPPETVAQFVPTILDYMGKFGGNDATSLLTKALGM